MRLFVYRVWLSPPELTGDDEVDDRVENDFLDDVLGLMQQLPGYVDHDFLDVIDG